MKITIILLVSFFLMACTTDDGFRIENDSVLYEYPWNEGFGTQIEYLSADPNTFEILGDDNMTWARDKDNVFWQKHITEGIDPDKFVVLSQKYAKDEEHVICDGLILKEADAKTFEVFKLENGLGEIEVFGKDKYAVYKCELRIPSSSVKSFKAFGGGFYGDKESINWQGLVLNVADVNSFRLLSGGYATDGRHIFYRGMHIINADFETFEVKSWGQAEDKNHKYANAYVED